MESGVAINNDGMGTNGVDYSESDFFKNAMNGNTTVTEPILDSSSGKMSVIIAAPIWDTSTVQTHMISQVTQGIEQISDVIQTNSATAEESAAASKELSNQALILKKMVGGFKLR